MASPVLDALVNARVGEQISEQNRRDQDIAASVYKLLGTPPTAPQMPRAFLEFAEAWKFCPFPCRPAGLAAYVLKSSSFGAETLQADLAAISAIHVANNLGDPVCGPVNAAMARIANVDAPRSWDKEEKQRWASLPLFVQRQLRRREDERDRGLAVSQQRLAEARKKLEAQIVHEAGSASPPSTSTKTETKNADEETNANA
jgi:hypothetical protein